MMANVQTGTLVGLTGLLVDVEVDVAGRGFPSLTIVGLPNKEVAEAKERVRTAIVNTSYDIPDSRITINLAPADLPKSGSGFDLPLAIGILIASGVLPPTAAINALFAGELSLQGAVRATPGILPLALLAKKRHISRIYIPEGNRAEASLIEGVEVYPVAQLADLIVHLLGKKRLLPLVPVPIRPASDATLALCDFSQIRGQRQAKRALEIAAAGFHNIHMRGSPGAGKTLLSRAMPSILPPLAHDEVIEVACIYSVAGQNFLRPLLYERPFRNPHHTISRAGLVGGGATIRPGEITLAHRGVLFLDEFPEFPRSVLEALRQPLEDGEVSVARASGAVQFPARFLLVAASNPCACGYAGHPRKRCRCHPGDILKYTMRLSGPLIDRIDLHVTIPPVTDDELVASVHEEPSYLVRQRVIQARLQQQERFQKASFHTNSEMNSQAVVQYCRLESDAADLLKQAVTKLNLSARSYFKSIKVAQTIADLDNSKIIKLHHISESLQYRRQE